MSPMRCKINFMFRYELATLESLIKLWDKNIQNNQNERCWKQWKKEYINYNENGLTKTFIIFYDNDPIGEGTLIFSPKCKATKCQPMLADNKTVANINALRISKEFEGQGHISKLLDLMENYASSQGYDYLTIGVEAQETRTLSIYLHLGYNKLVKYSKENGKLVLYYKKDISE